MKSMRTLWLANAMGFATILTFLGLYIAWLLWPLPDPAFDWDVAAAAAMDDGDCARVRGEIEAAAVAVPDLAMANLPRVADACRGAMGNAMFDRWAGDVRASAAATRLRYAEAAPQLALGARWKAFQEVAALRGETFLGPYSLFGLSDAFRCRALLVPNERFGWLKLGSAQEVQPASLRAWQSRLEECWRAYRSEMFWANRRVDAFWHVVGGYDEDQGEPTVPTESDELASSRARALETVPPHLQQELKELTTNLDADYAYLSFLEVRYNHLRTLDIESAPRFVFSSEEE